MSWRFLKSLTAVLIGGWLLAAVSACGDDKDVVIVGDDPRVLVHTKEMEAYPDMSPGGGALEYDAADKCLYLRSGRGRVAVVWPRGTEPVLKDGVRGVDVPELGVVSEGAVVGGSGIGFSYRDRSEGWAAQLGDVEAVTECLPQGAEVVVFNRVEVG